MPFTELETMDASDVYYDTTPEPPALISGILPCGLTTLAGDSKIGKSWLILWLCLQIAKGEPIWGVPVEKRTVIYLALEDSRWRLKKRMHLLTEDPPDNLVISFSCGMIGQELEDQIRAELKKHPDTAIIFIDTLQMIRDNAAGGGNAYAKDYKDLTSLKKLADEKQIGIFLVHHTRKGPVSDNPFDDMSGTKALQGAADTNWSLRKDTRFGNMATLSITGRDVEEKQLRLKKNGVVWECEETLDSVGIWRSRIPEWIFKVPELVLDRGHFIGTISELLEKLEITDLKPNVASKELAEFANDVLAPLDMEIISHRYSYARKYMIRIKNGYDAHDENDAKKRREKLAAMRGDTVSSASETAGNDSDVPLSETASSPSLPSPAKDKGFKEIGPDDDIPFDI
ncbi:MAG: AAA family ATPase [Lachnospiraceae bacterium]|nr:AAA family ATPase [Lachnospiraceae bacterium]